MENKYETHFVFTMGNHHALSICGVEIVNYADVVGGSYGFSMVPLLRGGTNARMEARVIIFKSRDSFYHMINFPDNIEGISNSLNHGFGWNIMYFSTGYNNFGPSTNILMLEAEGYSTKVLSPKTVGSYVRSIEQYFCKSQVFTTNCDASVPTIKFVHQTKTASILEEKQ